MHDLRSYRRNASTIPGAISTVLFLAVVAGCSGSGDAEEAATSGAAAESSEAAKPEAREPTMSEHELSNADPAWEGWTARAPEELELMQEGVQGARLAGNKAFGWDLIFLPRASDLNEQRELIQAGADVNEETTVSFLVETEDRLVWTHEYSSANYSATTWNFILQRSVGGQEVTCQNNSMIGLESEALMEQHIQACESLTPAADAS